MISFHQAEPCRFFINGTPTANSIYTYLPHTLNFSPMRLIFLFIIGFATYTTSAQTKTSTLKYTLSIPRAADHYVHVVLNIDRWNEDSIVLKMPQWTPGYYQLMNFAQKVENVTATDSKGKAVPVTRSSSGWRIDNTKKKASPSATM
jgi:hypothetical protein